MFARVGLKFHDKLMFQNNYVLKEVIIEDLENNKKHIIDYSLIKGLGNKNSIDIFFNSKCIANREANFFHKGNLVSIIELLFYKYKDDKEFRENNKELDGLIDLIYVNLYKLGNNPNHTHLSNVNNVNYYFYGDKNLNNIYILQLHSISYLNVFVLNKIKNKMEFSIIPYRNVDISIKEFETYRFLPFLYKLVENGHFLNKHMVQDITNDFLLKI